MIGNSYSNDKVWRNVWSAYGSELMPHVSTVIKS